MGEINRLQVVAAVFFNELNEVFCARRINNGNLALKWEFPGGKVECGENHEQALVREIEEELNLKIIVIKFFTTVNYDYEDFSIELSSYICKIVSGTIRLNVHEEYLWVPLGGIEYLDWATADIPIVKKLIRQHK